jgi:hypothetical protein
VYAIGGQVTKLDETEDVDLMVVTNTGYPRSFKLDFYNPALSNYRNHSMLIREIRNWFDQRVHVKTVNPLPHDYKDNGSKRKGLIKINPIFGKKIDLTFVSSGINPQTLVVPGEKDERYVFHTREDFEKRIDVDKEGRPLARVLLMENSQPNAVPTFL